MRKISFLFLGVALLAVVAVARAQATGFATFFAAVTAAGTTGSASGVTSSSRTGLGTYEVVFGRKIIGCATVASVAGSSIGFATTKGKDGSGHAVTVVVTTHAANGGLANLAFNLLVSCAP